MVCIYIIVWDVELDDICGKFKMGILGICVEMYFLILGEFYKMCKVFGIYR